MTASEAYEELESAIWRTDPSTLDAVRTVLAAADTYAATVTAEALAAIDHQRGCPVTAARRQSLIKGDGKHYGSTVT